MTFDASRVCRVCLEEGALSSLFSENYSMSLSEMIELCTSIKVRKEDGLPSRICGNCIFKLSVAYQFKQQAESSDQRIRQYLGLGAYVRFRDADVMTEAIQQPTPLNVPKCKCKPKQTKTTSQYKRKPESEKLRRGPKPKPKTDHTCYDCQKLFKCKAQLEMHIRTHTGEQPFGCAYCPRRFSQKYNLDIHRRIHTGEKPYQCEVCSKRFSAQGNLHTHLKIHSGQKDQICSICKKGFITTSELTRHMTTHRGVKEFKCDICGAAFAQSRSLKSHKQKKHNIDTNLPSKSYTDLHKVYNTAQVQLVTGQEAESKHGCRTCGESFHCLQLLSQHCSIKHQTYPHSISAVKNFQ